MQGVLVFLVAVMNAGIVLYDRYLLAIEMKMRVRHVSNMLKKKVTRGGSHSSPKKKNNFLLLFFRFATAGSGEHLLAAAQLPSSPHAGGREHCAAVDAEGRRTGESALGAACQR